MAAFKIFMGLAKKKHRPETVTQVVVGSAFFPGRPLRAKITTDNGKASIAPRRHQGRIPLQYGLFPIDPARIG
jgi:hypothetical protein